MHKSKSDSSEILLFTVFLKPDATSNKLSDFETVEWISKHVTISR